MTVIAGQEKDRTVQHMTLNQEQELRAVGGASESRSDSSGPAKTPLSQFQTEFQNPAEWALQHHEKRPVRGRPRRSRLT